MSENNIPIRSALISVYHKKGLDRIVKQLHEIGVKIYSTGGTFAWLEEASIPAIKIEDLTSWPSMLGGRVKTLHPKVFGGILGRRTSESDVAEMKQYEIPEIDLLIVDLYPFEDTLNSRGSHEDIIEKIDIGGISLIRAAAKNYNDVLVIPSQEYYEFLETVLFEQSGNSTYEQRKAMAATTFGISSQYDGLISQYLTGIDSHAEMIDGEGLRYGENPHQKAWFEGDLSLVFNKIQGKDLSYNNLVDIDAALNIIDEFEENTFCIIKHTNPCGVASGGSAVEIWRKALAGDSVSAFGGILATNVEIDEEAATEIDKIFFEVICAPSYSSEALKILSKKKNRIILETKDWEKPDYVSKTILNGELIQEHDFHTVTEADLKVVTEKAPDEKLTSDLLFANKIVKHAKSNTIVLAKDKQLIGIGVGQTSRVDALQQAIAKAAHFGFDVRGSVMASDAFFPFPDCVEIANNAGIAAVIQPGGSIKDQESIDYCNSNGLPMVTTGFRHFKH